jgi:hypothetical protein
VDIANDSVRSAIEQLNKEGVLMGFIMIELTVLLFNDPTGIGVSR